MLDKALAKKAGKKPNRPPHGLSRDKGQGTAMPLILGLVCAVIVLFILWLAYTYA